MVWSDDIENCEKKGSCQKCDFYKHVLDALVEPLVVVDSNGKIIFINKAYEEFLQVSRKEALGKAVQDVIENTRLHLFCSKKEAEIDSLQTIHDREAVVQRIPIIVDEKTIGAIGKVNYQNVHEISSLAKKLKSMESKLEAYKKSSASQMAAVYTFEDIIGCSPALESVKQFAVKAAASEMTVLILGETGVGKELFAQAIHNASPRHRGPFVSINCAAIPQDLLESELFGYEEGAFTGARKKGKPGKFELADGGTIFLDEVGDMPLRMQAKMLRVLQNRHIERIGSTASQEMDVRVIASTNQNVEEKVLNSEYRADLYYRLNAITLKIPPLRERREDISLLVDKTLEQLGSDKKFSRESMGIIVNSYWPGNVRELINVVERLVFLTDASFIEPGHLKTVEPSLFKEQEDKKDQEVAEPQSSKMLSRSINDTEKEVLFDTLKQTGWNKTRAAKLLGIHRTTLHTKMRKYGIQQKPL